MRYLILFLTMFTTSVFANTVSRQVPSINLTKRTITSGVDDLMVLRCVTLNQATTCSHQGSAYAAGGAGFRIYGGTCQTLGTVGDTLSIGYHSAILNNAAPAGTVFGVAPMGSYINSVAWCVERNSTASEGALLNDFWYGATGPLVPTGQYPWVDGQDANNYSLMYIWGKEE